MVVEHVSSLAKEGAEEVPILHTDELEQCEYDLEFPNLEQYSIVCTLKVLHRHSNNGEICFRLGESLIMASCAKLLLIEEVIIIGQQRHAISWV